jgi:hypothetical protein
MFLSTTCPVCGRQNFNPDKQCICGYYADENVVIDTLIAGFGEEDDENNNRKELGNIVKSKSIRNSEGPVIKEIDSWAFSFSQKDNCIYLGTPALQSFSLRLTLDDLEELLEFMYQQTGEEKTIRKRRVSAEEMPDLISKIERMIEEKRAKTSLEFDSDELQEISDLVNSKLVE